MQEKDITLDRLVIYPHPNNKSKVKCFRALQLYSNEWIEFNHVKPLLYLKSEAQFVYAVIDKEYIVSKKGDEK